jgi:hypothetical protein
MPCHRPGSARSLWSRVLWVTLARTVCFRRIRTGAVFPTNPRRLGLSSMGAKKRARIVGRCLRRGRGRVTNRLSVVAGRSAHRHVSQHGNKTTQSAKLTGWCFQKPRSGTGRGFFFGDGLGTGGPTSAQKEQRGRVGSTSDASLTIKFKRQHDVSERKSKCRGLEFAAGVALAAL